MLRMRGLAIAHARFWRSRRSTNFCVPFSRDVWISLQNKTAHEIGAVGRFRGACEFDRADVGVAKVELANLRNRTRRAGMRPAKSGLCAPAAGRESRACDPIFAIDLTARDPLAFWTEQLAPNWTNRSESALKLYMLSVSKLWLCLVIQRTLSSLNQKVTRTSSRVEHKSALDCDDRNGSGYRGCCY